MNTAPVSMRREFRIVGEFDDVLGVARADDGRHRAEGLLAKDGHRRFDVGEDRGCVIVAGTLERCAA
jgi:hypothetical protein